MQLDPVKRRLSDVIHSCVMEALQYPAGRTDRYTIIEFSMFEGRTVDAKKKLIRLLFERVQDALGIAPQDLEITIFETPKHNWGFRGLPGDEHQLNYKVEV